MNAVDPDSWHAGRAGGPMASGGSRGWLETAVVAGAALLLTNTAALATNLVVNGGFESGNTNFTSGYTYDATPSPGAGTELSEGKYTITTNAALTHGVFVGLPYEGSQFFVANGSSNTTLSPWASSAMTVSQTGVYRFQAYVCSVVPVGGSSPFAPPDLSFEISQDNSNWTTLGQTVAITNAAAGQWFQTYADTTLSTTGTYYIRLRNASNAFNGNDFGLDSIYFGLANAAPGAVPGTGLAAIGTLGLAGVARRRRR